MLSKTAEGIEVRTEITTGQHYTRHQVSARIVEDARYGDRIDNETRDRLNQKLWTDLAPLLAGRTMRVEFANMTKVQMETAPYYEYELTVWVSVADPKDALPGEIVHASVIALHAEVFGITIDNQIKQIPVCDRIGVEIPINTVRLPSGIFRQVSTNYYKCMEKY